jgi:hypothetical protein
LRRSSRSHRVEARFEIAEVARRPIASRGEKFVEAAVVVVAAAADRGHDLCLAGLGDVGRGFVERAVESGAVLGHLAPGAIPLAEQIEQRGRILPLEAFLHVLGGDHRVVVLGDDAARYRAHLAEGSGAPRAENAQRQDEAGITEQEFGP